MTELAMLAAALADRYVVEREIGAGGMATVYLARDLKHDRRVALKVLNPELGAVLGAERFLAEIKVTANLQHPNLLPLFDSGAAAGLLFYVMPYVEGESLRARLTREKQLPVDEAVRIAVAVANALEYAHAQGVIHRDLKPENILLQAGQPVVADFGIALAVRNAGGNRITQTGLSLGTPQYMSPEQATGDRVIDGRSDIYSLAAVTYEMLTGEPPHTGNTSQAIIARVLTEKPRPIRISRPAVPESVEAAVERALEKLPADRISTAREFAEWLQARGPAFTAGHVAPAVSSAAGGWHARLRDPWWLATVAAAAAMGAVALVMARRGPGLEPEPVQFEIAASDSLHPANVPPWPAAISDGGRYVVFATGNSYMAGTRLTLLRTDQLTPRVLPGTELATQALFSPDGEWIAFESGTKLRKVRIDGTAPVTIADAGSNNGMDWTVGNEIVLGAEGTISGLSHVSAAGGTLTRLTTVDSASGVLSHDWPIAWPDGRTIVFTLFSGALAGAELAITSLDDPRVTKLGVHGIRPLAVLDGEVVYVQDDGTVMAVQVDPRRRRVVAPPVPVHEPVHVFPSLNGNSDVFVSRTGDLVYARGEDLSALVWVASNGATTPVIGGERDYGPPRLSPDGRRIAVSVSDEGRTDIWILEVATGTMRRLTTTGGATSPAWSADGKTLWYIDDRSGQQTVTRQRADGSGPAEPMLRARANDVVPSPDGRALLLTLFRDNSWDVFRAGADSATAPTAFVATTGTDVAARFSPDGHWVALTSTESGTPEVYVRSYPDPGVDVQVSEHGGYLPVWSPDGTRLYFLSHQSLMAARVTTAPTFRVVSREPVFTNSNIASFSLSATYDVGRDGRILALEHRGNALQLAVDVHWLTEFRRRTALRTAR